MNVNTLGETGDDIGRRMAREVLFRHRIDDSEIDDEVPSVRPRQMCGCGRFTIARPYIKRGGKYVCQRCAFEIPRRPYLAPVTHSCAVCKKPLPRRLLVVRRGKLVCGTCKDKV